MRKWGKRYPDAGYGCRFYNWLWSKNPEPYGSYGNGSAMRVSAAGWLYDTLEETRRIARLTAEVTHNHPEGIKGAEATASAIFLARTGASKDAIRDYIVSEFGYDLSPAAVMRSDLPITMWRAARRQCPKQLLPSWKVQTSRT